MDGKGLGSNSSHTLRFLVLTVLHWVGARAGELVKLILILWKVQMILWKVNLLTWCYVVSFYLSIEIDCLEDISDHRMQKHMDNRYKSTFEKIPTLRHIGGLRTFLSNLRRTWEPPDGLIQS